MAKLSTDTRDRLLTIGAIAMLFGGLSLVAAAATMAWPGDPEPASSTESSSFEPAPTCDAPIEGASQRCGLPEGMSFSELSTNAADQLARRAALCMDYEHARISHDDYLEGLARLDAPPAPPLPARIWANELLAVSSEYGAQDWSAKRALGAPDVSTMGSDDIMAWASAQADGGREVIELGFSPSRINGLEIVESYNPGAIERIEFVTSSGRGGLLHLEKPGPIGQTSRTYSLVIPCTDEPISSLRITLNTAAVPGWNEIDAVALRPCR